MKKHINTKPVWLGLWIRTTLFPGVILILFSFGCKDDANPCEYEGCDARRQTIKIAEDVKGRVSVLDGRHLNLWAIVSEEGIIGDNRPIYDGPDVVVVCNMPDSLKTQGLRVIFSGELKDSCDDFEASISSIYYSNLTKIIKIE